MSISDRQRQMTITEELLDIVAGFEVLKEARACSIRNRG